MVVESILLKGVLQTLTEVTYCISEPTSTLSLNGLVVGIDTFLDVHVIGLALVCYMDTIQDTVVQLISDQTQSIPTVLTVLHDYELFIHFIVEQFE